MSVGRTWSSPKEEVPEPRGHPGVKHNGAKGSPQEVVLFFPGQSPSETEVLGLGDEGRMGQGRDCRVVGKEGPWVRL